MNDIMIAGVAATVVIYVIVEICKRLGAKDNVVLYCALASGLIVGIMAQITIQFPAVQPWYEKIVLGLLAAAAASGIYKYQKTIRGK